MRSPLLLAALLIAASGALSAQPLLDESQRPVYEEGVVAVKLREAPAAARPTGNRPLSGVASLDAELASMGASSMERAFRLAPSASRGQPAPAIARIYYVRYASGEDVHTVAARLSRDPAVEYAEPVPMNYSHGLPTDGLYEFLQHLPQIKATEAWAVHRGQDGGQDVVIAITDAGVEWYHPDLAANLWHNPGEDANGNGRTVIERDGTWTFDPGDLNRVDDDGNGYVDDLIGWNFSRWSNDPNTGQDHGTHVAGIAGAVTDNGIGVASISHNVKLMPVASWSSSCQCLPNPYQMLIYAAENGAHIINASWGGTGFSRSDEEVIRYVRSLGSIVVSSAGNLNSAAMNYPDGYPGVVSVASVAVTDQKATYSSFGARVSVSAPGGQTAMFADSGILSTGNNGTYVRYHGTSMASPMVAGLLALVKSYRPEWTNEQVIKQVIGTADDLSAVNPTYPGMLGAGRINALRALTETELNLPQGLRLHVTESELYDQDYDGLFVVGETGRLSVRLGNFALFVDAAELVLTLEADHEWIEILSPPVFTPLAYDGDVRATFDFRILPGATSGLFPIRLRASADVPVESGEVFEFELTVAAGGVLVWDGRSDPRYFSGRFIYDFLTEQGVPAIYVGSSEDRWGSVYPSSFMPFDAIFLSVGSGPNDLWWMTGPEQSVLASYLENGGKVYLEGSGVLEISWSGQPALLSALGIAAIEPGPWDKAAPEVLVGLEGSILEGLVFPGYGQQPIAIPKRYTAGEGGVLALDEPGYGAVAVQSSGPSGRRSFVSSYALVNMADGSLPSHRRYFLMQLLDFFGIEGQADFAHVGFSADVLTGHAPLTVQFTDRSTFRDTTPLREWDLTGDGHMDAVGEAVTWTYLEPGTYPVRLRITAEGRTHELERTEYVRVFGGNAALTFGAPAGKVVIPASGVSRLNLNAFTVEAWIRPDGWGLFPSGFGRIIDKSRVLLFVDIGGHLVLSIEHPDGTTSRLSTDAGTLTLGEWQHVAASYDGEGRVELLINGVPHPLNHAAALPAPIRDNRSLHLYVGNNEANTRAFQGEIDEVRLWTGVRTASQIQVSMHAPLTGEEPGLIGYWPFDEGAGTAVLDATPFRLHGTAADTEWRAGFMSNPVSVEELSPTPVVFGLSQNYPNPFRSSTLITYHLTSDERVTLEVFNGLGQRVALLADERQPAGEYNFTFDGSGMASGVYFYQLRTDSAVLARRMILVR